MLIFIWNLWASCYMVDSWIAVEIVLLIFIAENMELMNLKLFTSFGAFWYNCGAIFYSKRMKFEGILIFMLFFSNLWANGYMLDP